MKKLVLTTVCAFAVSGAAFAQGTVNWSTIVPSAMTAQTNSAVSPLFGGSGSGGIVGSTAVDANGFFYELLYNAAFTGSQAAAPTAAQLFGGTWLDAGLSAVNAASLGRLSPVGANNGATVPWSPGTTNNIVMVGWSADLGTTWTGVSNILASLALGNNSPLLTKLAGQAGFFGVSAAGYTTTLVPPTAPGASVFGTGATSSGLPIFSLNTSLYALPVPEPATMALAGLGGLSLLLFRRQRK
jgi:hypothetical protein